MIDNPKDAIGRSKTPMWLNPPAALIELARALEYGAYRSNGGKGYGAWNWRSAGISASVYLSAIQRHYAAFLDGQDLDADSGISHLAHIMANCAIMLDSVQFGKLQDDRPSAAGAEAPKGTIRPRCTDYFCGCTACLRGGGHVPDPR